ncbi:hypothetical protein [Nannocystis pusilla]|uniref:HflX-like GTP-binding protein n=1 Tax=Nannocystis pusilla TaxID=889268 RepID=UPI003B8279DA
MPRALVLGRQFPGDTDASVHTALAELENLLAQLEIRVVATLIQRHRSADPALGEGKLAEIAARIAEVRGDAQEDEKLLLVVDDALSPAQLRALEDALADVEVIDRASVILRIFENTRGPGSRGSRSRSPRSRTRSRVSARTGRSASAKAAAAVVASAVTATSP